MRRLLTTALGGALGLGLALTPITTVEAATAVSTALSPAVAPAAAKAKKAKKTKYPKPGQRGKKVRKLQRRLVKAGLMRKVTGKYRKGTKRAVKRFQRRHHLKVTGKVNARTWRLLVAATTPTRQPPPPPPLPPAPLVVAHRGAVVAGIGENTMAAMRYAADNGARVLEFDVRWTSDDVPVAMHDQDLKRTTNCTGNVSSHSWPDLVANCQVAAGQPIPAIAEIADFAHERGLAISPEIKKKSPRPVEITGLKALLKPFDPGSVYLQSFETEPLEMMREEQPGYAGFTGPIVYLTNTPVAAPYEVPAGTAIIGQRIGSTLTPALIAGYRNAGYQVWAWTARTSAELASARSLRVDAVVADDAPAALRFYAAQG